MKPEAPPSLAVFVPPTSAKKRQLSPASSVDEPSSTRPWREIEEHAESSMLPPANTSPISTEPQSEPNAKGRLEKLNDDCLQTIFLMLPAKDLAHLAAAGSSKLYAAIKAFMGVTGGTFAPMTNRDVFPDQFYAKAQVHDTLVVLEVGKEMDEGVGCWFSSITAAEKGHTSWKRCEVTFGSLLTPWKGFNCCATAVIGKTLYIYGGRSPPLRRFLETPDPPVGTTDSQDSSEIVYTISNRMFMFDTESLELREVAPSSEGGSSQGSAKSSESKVPHGTAEATTSPAQLRLHSRPSLAGTGASPHSTPSRSSTSGVSIEWGHELMCHSMDAVKDRWLVIFGGCRYRSEGENDTLLFDTVIGGWSWPHVSGGTKPSRRFNHASCVGPHGEIYIFGGTFFGIYPETRNDLHALVVLDAAHVCWTRFLSPRHARSNDSRSSPSGSQAQRNTATSRRRTGSTESIASTQLASQTSRQSQAFSSASLAPDSVAASQRSYASIVTGVDPSFVTPPVAAGFSSSTTSSTTSLSTGGMLRTTGFDPRDRSGASMIILKSSKLVIFGGRDVTENRPPGGLEWENVSPESWYELVAMDISGLDIFDLHLRHWSEIFVETGEDSGNGKGKATATESYAGKLDNARLFLKDWTYAIADTSDFQDGRNHAEILLVGHQLNMDSLVKTTSSADNVSRTSREPVPPRLGLPSESTSKAFETMQRSVSQDLPGLTTASRHPFLPPLRPYESFAILPGALTMDVDPSGPLTIPVVRPPALPPRSASPDVFSTTSSSALQRNLDDKTSHGREFLFLAPTDASGDRRPGFVTFINDDEVWYSSFDIRRVSRGTEMGDLDAVWDVQKLGVKRWEGWLRLE